LGAAEVMADTPTMLSSASPSWSVLEPSFASGAREMVAGIAVGIAVTDYYFVSLYTALVSLVPAHFMARKSNVVVLYTCGQTPQWPHDCQ
jgi:hypothetical protein